MLGLYLYTLTLSYSFCSMLSIRNELTLQKELPKLHVNNIFALQSEALPLSHWVKWSISIESKLFNYLNLIVENINKQSHICGPHFINKITFFCNISTCTDNYIWQFLILATLDSLLRYVWKVRCKQFWSKETGIASLSLQKNSITETFPFIIFQGQ